METLTSEELLAYMLISAFIVPVTGALLLMWLTNKTIDKKIEVLKSISEEENDIN